MSDTVLWGEGADLVVKPCAEWLAAIHARAPLTREKLRLTGAARAVREYAVRELARNSGRPLAPERISAALGLPLAETQECLRDLEKRLFFVVLDAQGRVSWAFPVTSARTPHQVRLSIGENTWGA